LRKDKEFDDSDASMTNPFFCSPRA